MVLANGLKEEHEALFSWKFTCVKKQDFYIKRQLSYSNIFCKKTAFLQKHFSVKSSFLYMLHKKTVIVKKASFLCKKSCFFTNWTVVKILLFYVKKLLFYKLTGCKNTAFLQKYIFVKKQLFYVKKLLFYKLPGCKNTAFLQNIFL